MLTSARTGAPHEGTPSRDGTTRPALADLYLPIGEDLERAEAILARELDSKLEFVRELTSRVQLYQGKRLRPALLLLTARACGKVTPAHHTLAAVVEMIHAATLVHDDILDEADRRRHVITVNSEWGNEASVLLGDYLFTHSFHLAATLDSTFACRWIGRATNLVCEGELHQISRRGYFELSEEEYFSIITGKTAELTACCCGLGAHYAGATGEVETAMSHYGRELGIAFQIADDMLDLQSDEDSSGKSLGSDLAKQKLTLPIIRLRDTGDRALLAACRGIWDNPGPSARKEMLELLRRSDAIEYALGRAKEIAQSAADRLNCLPQSAAKDVLLSMARFVVDRPY